MSEYWIVDPLDQQVEQWVLREERYVLIPETQLICLCCVSDIEVDFDKVW